MQNKEEKKWEVGPVTVGPVPHIFSQSLFAHMKSFLERKFQGPVVVVTFLLLFLSFLLRWQEVQNELKCNVSLTLVSVMFLCSILSTSVCP